MLAEIVVGVVVSLICSVVIFAGRLVLKHFASNPPQTQSVIDVLAASLAFVCVVVSIGIGWVLHFVVAWLAQLAAVVASPKEDADTAVVDFLATAEAWPWQWSAVAVVIASSYVTVDACRDPAGMLSIWWAGVVAAATSAAGAGHYALETALVSADASISIPWSLPWSALMAACAMSAFVAYRELRRVLAAGSA